MILVEIMNKIVNYIEDGTHTFQINELHIIYTKRLQELGIISGMNETSFKNKLLNHLKDVGLRDIFRNGKTTQLIFPDGIKELLQDSRLLRNFQKEAFLFSKVAFTCREELFTVKN